MKPKEILKLVPEIRFNEELHTIFSKQQGILNLLPSIQEDFPSLPLELDSKKNQLFIRDLVGRIIEELSEAFEVYSKISPLLEPSPDSHPESLIGQMEEILFDFNEEISDTLHFLVELMLVSNIQEEDIVSYYEIMLKEKGLLDAFFSENAIMATICRFSRHCNIQDYSVNNPAIPRHRIAFLTTNKDSFIRGGNIHSHEMVEEVKKQMWDFTYHLNLCLNKLKNNPWKQTPTATDVGEYHKYLMESWLYFFKLLDFLDYDADSICRIYTVKNYINLKRIEEKR